MGMEMAMRLIVVLSSLFPLSSPVIHSLKYIETASMGNIGIPEFVHAMMVDGVMVGSYDSSSQMMFPKQEWVKELDQQEWSKEILRAKHTGIELIESLKYISQTQGPHVYQRMCGCEWDEETGTTHSYEQHGYDGQNFLSLDVKQMRWTAHVPEAEESQKQRNDNKRELMWLKNDLTQECIYKLKKYVAYGNSTLRRKVPPQVSLLKDAVSSVHYHKVVCHATGFYPEGVLITWKKHGVDILEDVNVGETLPNEDGTFQKRAEISVSHEEWMKSQYTCEVEHTSVGTISKQLTPEEDLMLCNIAFIAVIALVTVMIAVIIAIMWWKKKS